MNTPSAMSQPRSGISMQGFLLCVIGIVLLDQISKQLVVMYISPYTNSGERILVMGDFFRIIHVRNSGLAFSLGASFPDLLKRVAYVLFPLVLLAGLGVFLLRDKQLKIIQRWALACIIGGGVGNVIDRIFRGGWVVDFLDFKFFGLFGMERWPTFNVADSAVVIGVFLFILGGLIGKKTHK